MAYYSDDPSRDGRRRRINVQVDRPDLRVRTIGGFFALPPQVEVLRADLKDSDPAVRAEAARALAYLDLPDADRLLRSALHDRAPAVRAAAARGLGIRRTEGATPLLARALGDKATTVRTSAYDALLGVGQPATPEILKRLPQAEGFTCVLIVRLLGEIGDERALEPVAQRLASPRPEERLAAAEALGTLGLSGGLGPLDRALEDVDLRVRAHAIRSVAAIGGNEAVRLLETYGGREADPDLRHLAADALATVLNSIRGR
jgi:HEAT repeat protein